MNPEEILSRLLYRDALMLVIDKPAGIPVHKGTGGGENLEQYFEHLRFGLPHPPSLAHRLDRDTSGCLILGRNRHALATLGKLFTHDTISKTYVAIVEGTPAQPEGIIDLPLEKRSQHKSRWQMQVAAIGGVSAITHYQLLATHNDISYLKLMPKTGRTHQLRVHCAAMGWPIIGDRHYGNAGENMMLHASSIEVPLYPNKPTIRVEAPLPVHIQNCLKKNDLSADSS